MKTYKTYTMHPSAGSPFMSAMTRAVFTTPSLGILQTPLHFTPTFAAIVGTDGTTLAII